MQSYIICHEQKIADKSKLNKSLHDPEWVMVGNGKFTSGIIARKLPRNIEQHPYLVAYTGWHCLANNGYIQDDEYYNMLEYDVVVTPGFMKIILQYIKPKQVIGFIPFSIDHPLFMGQGTELLQSSIKDVYGIDVQKVIYDEIARSRKLWCSTSNCCIQGRDMKAFVAWFDPLIPHFKRNPMAAHYPERALRIFMAINGLEPLCITNILHHEQKKSHGIEFAL